jgi:glycosyltransferase involved in cell wall biosynthesis
LALGQGGFSRAAGIFWPEDLPDPGLGSKLFNLPPVIHPKFADTIRESSLPELPETYILYHGPQTAAALHQLVEAWSWATGSIGEYYPLLVLGFDQPGSARLNALLEQSALKKTVSLLPPLTLESTAYLYQNCTAVFHPAGIPPWGGPLRNALFFGKPLIALATPFSDALVGPAGYLVKPGKPDSSRALGAALITVIVEENVAANLAQAARQRAAGWKNSAFSSALEAAYQVLLSSG